MALTRLSSRAFKPITVGDLRAPGAPETVFWGVNVVGDGVGLPSGRQFSNVPDAFDRVASGNAAGAVLAVDPTWASAGIEAPT